MKLLKLKLLELKLLELKLLNLTPVAVVNKKEKICKLNGLRRRAGYLR